MTVQTEIVNLTTATTSLLNEVITKKSVLDEAEGKATAALDATKVSEAAAKASEIAAKTSENNAQTQADRAKTEADRASQISGLSTVSDAIGLASLPLPDVWAPLSDSLRMITGYGREVKVGEDVVARMVNFSRSTTATYIGKDGQLKTAAANEPRFEKEGLLIEGQSTNLIARSEGISMSNPGGSNTVVQNNIADFLPGFLCVRATFNNPSITNADHIRITPSLQAGKTYTWSIVTDSPDRRVITYSATPGVIQNSVLSVTKISDRLWRQAQTFTMSSAFVPGTDYIDVRIIANGVVAGTVVNAGAIQLEELPFASSYIPTNGSAVTRAADYVTIPRDGNLPTDTFTFCVTVADFSTFDSTYHSVVFAPESSAAKERFYLAHGADKKPILVIGRDTIKAPSANLLVKPFGVSVSIGGAAKLFCNGSVQVSASAIGAIALDTTLRIGGYKSMSQAGGLFGHVRNLRIWHRALTDDQIKAVA